jgi:hypothetical protein
MTMIWARPGSLSRTNAIRPGSTGVAVAVAVNVGDAVGSGVNWNVGVAEGAVVGLAVTLTVAEGAELAAGDGVGVGAADEHALASRAKVTPATAHGRASSFRVRCMVPLSSSRSQVRCTVHDGVPGAAAADRQRSTNGP